MKRKGNYLKIFIGLLFVLSTERLGYADINDSLIDCDPFDDITVSKTMLIDADFLKNINEKVIEEDTNLGVNHENYQYMINGNNWWPLSVGNSWAFKYTSIVNSPYGEFTSNYTLTQTVILGGSTPIIKVKTSTSEGYSNTELTLSGRTISILSSTAYDESGSQTSKGVYSPPLLALPSSMIKSTHDTASSTLTMTVPGEPSVIWQIKREYLISGYEKVTVPAGIFFAVKVDGTEIQTTNSFGIDREVSVSFTTWLAWGIGTIKVEQEVNSDNVTSTILSELTNYTIK